MKALTKSIPLSLFFKTENANVKFWKDVEFNRFGITPLLLVAIACIGGLAVAFGAQGNTIKLLAVSLPTMIALALILAVSPMRAIFYGCSIAIVCDLIVLVF